MPGHEKFRGAWVGNCSSYRIEEHHGDICARDVDETKPMGGIVCFIARYIARQWKCYGNVALSPSLYGPRRVSGRLESVERRYKVLG